MTSLDSCLSIIEPGYHAPQADRPIFEARVRPAHRLCACGVDEVREGRTQCEECIGKTAAGTHERIRHRIVERAAKAARRARERAEREKAAGAMVVQHACTCGRPARAGATCGRRVCR